MARSRGMRGLELSLMFLAVATALAPLARRIDVPFPIVLVLGDLTLAFLPGLPQVALPPAPSTSASIAARK